MRIKEVRTQKGVSQKELAEIIGVAPNTLSQYENERRTPDFDTLAKISDYFHVSVDYLLGLNEQQKKPTPVSGDGLSEAEQSMLKLFRMVPVKDQGMVTQMIEAALRSRRLL